MIVGANGCGKTTVIECLKYACTGALPPGARNGQSFVHDPKVSGTNEVKANIKLRFSARDRTASGCGDPVLPANPKAEDPPVQGARWRHQIPLRLGVSKAILENVVFCHQEDASWPLQEGAVVKKKFDDIFESARYTKALENIKKTKQEYASAVKELKVDLAALQERLRAANDLKEEMDASTETYSNLRKEIEAIDERTAELSESLEKLRAVADEVRMLEERKQSLLLACRDLDVRMTEKRDNIGDGEMSSESDETLRKNLQEFDDKLAVVADEIQFYADEADRCRERAEAAKKKKDRLQGEQGSVQAQLTQQEREVAARDGMMKSLCSQYDIFNPAPSASAAGSSEAPAPATLYTSSDVASFQESLQATLDKAQKALDDVIAKNRSEEDTMNEEMNSLKLEQRSSLEAVEAKERELRKIQSDATSLSRGGGSAAGAPGGSQSQLGTATVSKLKRELEAAQAAKEQAIKESDDFFQNDKSQEVARESKVLEGRLSEIRLGVEEEEAAVKALSSQQQEQSQIAVKTAQIEDDEGRLDERVKAEPAFTNASVINPPQDVTEASLGSVATELRMASSKLESDRVDKARQVMDLHREVANNNTNLVNTKREKSRVQLRLGELSRAVKVVEDSMRGLPDPPGEALDAAKHYDWVGGAGFSVTLFFRCFGE
ncbi:unnamed protein product [Ectocarpus sp. CCAP 1310/34]|nr:unnamed protein product [Ectocarpus sp. CCAP 1310/34]